MSQPTLGPAEPDEPTPSDEFVIEELSRRTGVTVRSLRSYQSRKLLPPPVVRGRTGYYDRQHVARVQLIQDLQAEGLKLDGIARMLDAEGRTDEHLLRFTRSVRGMFGDPTDAPVTTALDLAERFGATDGDAGALLAKAVRLGLLRDLGDGKLEELAPRLLAAGEAAMQALDLEPAEALNVVAQLRKHADGVARIYVDLFLRRVWQPFMDAGQPEELWPSVQQSLENLRTLATEALDSAFELVMSERVAETFPREFSRPRRGRRR
ncbi:MerR family transcriptional regulator [Nocardioides ferulae]|uniref:MerR family transcriptional regulator n=1 Tax=Nocardioides ferulae TaxID=2340821 RepID=UPI000EB15524|nr:MerR family transcriptional regulator [Nocardioides ferulae]